MQIDGCGLNRVQTVELLKRIGLLRPGGGHEKRGPSEFRGRALHNCGDRAKCSARFVRRISFKRVIQSLMLPGASQSRSLNWYFSESRYSSRPGNASFSQSSYPL